MKKLWWQLQEAWFWRSPYWRGYRAGLRARERSREKYERYRRYADE